MKSSKLRCPKIKGKLVIIGGREDKTEEMRILTELVRLIDGGKVCVATVASSLGESIWEEYHAVFRHLGAREVTHLGISHRRQTKDAAGMRALAKAKCVFFTGGDQLKITSELGGTAIEDRIREIYADGGIIAGTSAGASVMSDTMLVSGVGVSSYRIGGGLRMAPGLGFLSGVLIDQHFTERGRIGRLLGALAHNPKYLGLGVDENTAVIVEEGRRLRTVGIGGVYVVDAHEATDSNISDKDRDTALSLFNVKIHLLSDGDIFDLETRVPELIVPNRRPEIIKKRPARAELLPPLIKARTTRLREKGLRIKNVDPKSLPRA